MQSLPFDTDIVVGKYRLRGTAPAIAASPTTRFYYFAVHSPAQAHTSHGTIHIAGGVGPRAKTADMECAST